MALISDSTVRRTLRPGDADAIVELHDQVYGAGYGVDERFAASVAKSVHAAVERGWPDHGGAVWLIDDRGRLAGSLALTHESPGCGRIRWFVLAPEVRGRGLGRRLIDELLALARADGLERLELETFSALTTAAHIYRSVGFQLVWERETDWWGPAIVYQRYEMQL
jgi:GNAT superfamily N-acetyltransferase